VVFPSRVERVFHIKISCLLRFDLFTYSSFCAIVYNTVVVDVPHGVASAAPVVLVPTLVSNPRSPFPTTPGPVLRLLGLEGLSSSLPLPCQSMSPHCCHSTVGRHPRHHLRSWHSSGGMRSWRAPGRFLKVPPWGAVLFHDAMGRSLVHFPTIASLSGIQDREFGSMMATTRGLTVPTLHQFHTVTFAALVGRLSCHRVL
jgi:hypothetical protein